MKTNRIINNIRSSWLNVIGLAIGYSCFIIIALWVSNEKSYDSFNKDVKRLYRITRYETSPQGFSDVASATTPSLLGPTLTKNLPEINNYARFYRLDSFLGEVQVEYDDKKFYEKNYCFADPSFFTLFNFPFITGNAGNVFVIPNSVVITEEIASKYFTNEDPIGKTIRITNVGEYLVSGVIENVPSNSHIKFDFISPLEPIMTRNKWMGLWNIPHFYTYLSLKDGMNENNLNLKIEKLFDGLEISELISLNTKFRLQPVSDIHLKSELGNEFFGNGIYISRIIRMFTVLASFVLLISCINFMIIFIAKAFERKTEIGIKKTFGATRFTIAKIFYFETIVLIITGFLMGLFFVLNIIPAFNNYIGIDIFMHELGQIKLITILILIIFLSSLISGLYPAIFISSFMPVQLIRGTLFAKNKKVNLIKAFVIIQYTLTLFFIIGSFVYAGQYKYLIKKDLGYSFKNLHCIRNTNELKEHFEVFKTTLLNNPSILNISSCSDLPDETVNMTIVKGWEGANVNDQVMMNFLYVDKDYINTMGIKLMKGRNFEFPNDELTGFIINEEAEKQMGIKDAINKGFNINGFDGKIIGVIKDFNLGSLAYEINPLVIKVQSNFSKYVLVSMREENTDETLRYIETNYIKFSPKYHFESWPLNTVITNMYQNEQKSSRLILLFSIIGILITSFGLYGLVDYSLRIRMKEIGIRKVIGASSVSIMNIFFKEYGIMILFASLFAWPASFYNFSNWLNNYAYNDSIKLWHFICATLVSIIITITIILMKTYYTSKINPSQIIK